MARPVAPVRVFRVANIAVADNAVEDIEIDLNLVASRGIHLLAVEFNYQIVFSTPSGTFEDHTARLTLHRRTDTLEDATPVADVNLESSEIIAETVFAGISQAEAATRGGSAGSLAPQGPVMFPYLSMLGQPLLVAGNLTFRSEVLTHAGTTSSFCVCRLWYQHVQLTPTELLRSFLQRRV